MPHWATRASTQAAHVGWAGFGLAFFWAQVSLGDLLAFVVRLTTLWDGLQLSLYR